MKIRTAVTLLGTLTLALGCGPRNNPNEVKLLNISYDPTRELYQEVNQVFSAQWKAQTGQTLTIEQSHGGSGKQARAGIDGRSGKNGSPKTLPPTPRLLSLW